MVVEVARTSKVNEYEVNHRKISLLESQGIQELKTTIQKALPSTAKNSLWMNKAYAATEKDPAVETLSTTIALVLTSTSDKEICEAAARVVTICEDYPGRSISAKTVTKIISVASQRMNAMQSMKTSINEAIASGLSVNEAKAFDSAISNMKSETNYLEESIGRLQNRQKMLMSCPSARASSDGTAWDDIQSCRKGIQSAYDFTSKFAQGMLHLLRGTDKDLENVAAANSKFQVSEPAQPEMPAESTKRPGVQ